jgi:cardiolipin synthase
MTIPNLITIGRLFLAPLVIVMIVNANWDGLHPFRRRRHLGCDRRLPRQALRHGERAGSMARSRREQGGSSIYITLAVVGAVPVWLVVLVVART